VTPYIIFGRVHQRLWNILFVSKNRAWQYNAPKSRPSTAVGSAKGLIRAKSPSPWRRRLARLDNSRRPGQNILDWLKVLAMSEYYGALAKNRIDFSALPERSDRRTRRRWTSCSLTECALEVRRRAGSEKLLECDLGKASEFA
jgi:hypothetical protein